MEQVGRLDRGDGVELAWAKLAGRGPTVVFLPGFKPHDLRHYFISNCVTAGFDFMTIAKWAGHSDGGVLIGKIYGHLRPGHTKELARRLSFDDPAAATGAAPAQRVGDLSVEELLKLVRTAAPAAPAP